MKPDVIKALLGHLNSKNIQTTGQWIKASCPLAPYTHKSGHDNNPSFGIKIEEKIPSYFNCYTCNSGGSLESLLLEILHLSKGNVSQLNIAEAYKLVDADELTGFHTSNWSEFENPVSREKFHAWDDKFLSSFMPAYKSPIACDYLTKRNITLDMVTDFDIRFDTGRETVCFPFRNHNNKLAGMRGRYINPTGELRYHDYAWFDLKTLKKVNNTKHVWFNEHRIDWDKTIVLCEGAFDTVTIYQQYQNVMSPLSTGMSFEKIDRLKQAVKVLCFFDNDLAGQTAYEKIVKAVGSAVIVKQVTYPEGTKYKADASDLTTEVLQSMLSQFVKLNPI